MVGDVAVGGPVDVDAESRALSRNEDIDNAIWDDPDFEALSKNATLLYLWSFTNPRCDMAGIYKVSHVRMTESKLSLEEIPGALAELAVARFAFYEDHVLWVRARVKRLRSRSPQMAKAVARDLQRVSVTHALRRRFLDEYGSDPWLREQLAGAYREPIGNLSEKPIGKGDLHTLSVPSREGTGKGQGQSSSSSSTENVGGEGQNHARSLSALFDYWRDQCRHPKAKFTPERRRKLDARLKEDYSEEQIRQGIDGAALNPPRSDDGVVHDDLVSICRNGAQLERYIARATTSRPAAVSHLPEYQRASPEHQAQLDAHVANPGPEPEWLQGAKERMQADLDKRRAAG